MKAMAPNGKQITRSLERILGTNGIYDFRMGINFEFWQCGDNPDPITAEAEIEPLDASVMAKEVSHG